MADHTEIDALRDVEIPWLMEALGNSIAGLGYPVGLGIAPSQEHLRIAATALFERFVSISKFVAAAQSPAIIHTEKREP